MWLYEHNEDNTARYILGEPGSKTLACFGINPSTATPEKLDPTLIQVKHRAEMHGYDGWMMFNVYPQRAPNPKDLHKEIDEFLHNENLRVIEKFISEYECDVWAAWGTLIEKRSYFRKCLSDIIKCLPATVISKFVKIGKISVKGHPHHPLYLSHEHEPEPFDIVSYNTEPLSLAETKKYRLLDRKQTTLPNVVGFCHNIKHRGWISKALLKKHRCLEKQCTLFKPHNNAYWDTKEREENERIKEKARIKEQKRDKQYQEYLIREAFAEHADVHITAIENTGGDYLIKYIYDNRVDMTGTRDELRHRLGCNVRLQAIKGNDKAIEMLIRKRKGIAV